MKPEVQPNKIVVFTGAGVSAESGLPTFRDSGGLWRQHSWRDVASPEAWGKNPGLVLDFYNERRLSAWQAKPNAAHAAIAALETQFDVVVVTQNVDELHERAGSSQVIHLHGNLAFARSSVDPSLRHRIDHAPIQLGQCSEDGSQLRPDVVWFGEAVQNLDLSTAHIETAARVLVVGTSLSVFPAAGLIKRARGRAEKLLVSTDMEKLPYGFRFERGNAAEVVPRIVQHWLRDVR